MNRHKIPDDLAACIARLVNEAAPQHAGCKALRDRMRTGFVFQLPRDAKALVFLEDVARRLFASTKDKTWHRTAVALHRLPGAHNLALLPPGRFETK